MLIVDTSERLKPSGAPAMVKRSSTPFARLHRSASGEGATVSELELASQSSIDLLLGTPSQSRGAMRRRRDYSAAGLEDVPLR